MLKKKYHFLKIDFENINTETLKSIFTYGGLSIFYTLAFIMIYQGSMIITGIIISVAAITYLQLAYKLFNIINSVSLYLCSAVLPSSSAAIAAGDEQYINKLMINGLRILLSIVLPVTIVIYLLSPDIIRIWISDEFVESAGNISRILLISWYLYCPATLFSQIYFGQKDIAFLSGNAFIAAILFTFLSILLGYFHGLNGIVWACSIYYMYIGTITIFISCKSLIYR